MSETAEALTALTQNIERLLNLAGKKATCRYCGMGVWFVQHKASSALAPYEADGTPHQIRCINERYERFREQHKLAL